MNAIFGELIGIWILVFGMSVLLRINPWFMGVTKRAVRAIVRGTVTRPLKRMTKWLWMQFKFLYKRYPLQFTAFIIGFFIIILIANALSK